jgi:hypothetical protein
MDRVLPPACLPASYISIMMPTALLRDAFVVVAVAAVLSSAAHPPSSRLSAIRQLKAELHTLTAEEAAQRFRQLGDTHRLTSPPPRQRKIDHFVVLYQENRGFDHIYGCMDLPGADGIIGHTIPLLPEHPKLGHVNVTCGTAPYVCKGGPGFSTFSGHFRKGTNAKKYPYATQDDAFSYQNGGHGVAIEMFSPEQLPVKRALAKEYGVFNKLYTATPTASTPNHHFTQSATSCGSTNNNDYTDCGGKTLLFPQMTMYDTMWMDNVSFRFYMNSTCNTREGRPCNSVGPHKDTSPVYAPVSWLFLHWRALGRRACLRHAMRARLVNRMPRWRAWRATPTTSTPTRSSTRTPPAASCRRSRGSTPRRRPATTRATVSHRVCSVDWVAVPRGLQPLRPNHRLVCACVAALDHVVDDGRQT